MKRKKSSKGSFNKLKRNDLVITNDPNSPSISIEGENNMDTSSECQGKFEVEVEQPITVDNKLSKSSRIDTDIADFKSTMKIGYSRVKVKLKPSKLVELHERSSDALKLSTPRDTDTNSSHFVSEVNEMSAGKLNNTCSDSQTLEASYLVPENPARKPGTIKIKSSRGSDFHHMQMVPEGPHKGSPYNKKELSAALGVIRKIMKMDAAVPFNAPVNPVALGIPDYFDIINTPMDFGSICHDLEHGTKYKNSLDVYKDVQFIWDNCYKYNNKGDYILDLMKRVKKNFMKYWTAAGLLTVGTQVDDVLWPHQEKSVSKIKSKQKRRRYGIDGHKSNCLCAVCVVRRRRKEREEHSAAFESHIMVSHVSSPNEPKLEVMSTDNPCSEGTASSLDRSPETDADADMDDAGKLETVTSLERIGSDAPERLETISREIEIYANAANNETSGNILHENGNSNQHSYDQECLHSNSSKHSDKKDEDEGEDDDEDEREGEYEDQDEDEEIQHEELFSSGREMKSFENPPQQENHSALWLLKELFPGEQNSVWNGPHSLNRRHTTAKQNNNPIKSALETMMNS